MSETNPIKKSYGNISFVNNLARAHYISHHGINKDLVLLHASILDGVVMTQEAYTIARKHMDHEDLQTHIATLIDGATAALITENVLTTEDMHEFFKGKA